jgi:hypothetical protein
MSVPLGMFMQNVNVGTAQPNTGAKTSVWLNTLRVLHTTTLWTGKITARIAAKKVE